MGCKLLSHLGKCYLETPLSSWLSLLGALGMEVNFQMARIRWVLKLPLVKHSPHFHGKRVAKVSVPNPSHRLYESAYSVWLLESCSASARRIINQMLNNSREMFFLQLPPWTGITISQRANRVTSCDSCVCAGHSWCLNSANYSHASLCHVFSYIDNQHRMQGGQPANKRRGSLASQWRRISFNGHQVLCRALTNGRAKHQRSVPRTASRGNFASSKHCGQLFSLESATLIIVLDCFESD